MKTIAGMLAAAMLAGCGGGEDCVLTEQIDLAGHDGTGLSTCVDYFREGEHFAHCDVTGAGEWTCVDSAGNALNEGALRVCRLSGN